MLQIVLLVACSSTAFAKLPLMLTDCNNSPNKIIHFENYHIGSDPIKIPGNNSGDIDVQVLQPISGNHYELKLTVTKNFLFSWVVVPCYWDFSKNFCTWDLCTLLSGRSYNNTHRCPTEVLTSSPDFPCACPFSSGQYHLNPTSVVIDTLPPVLRFFGQGDYRAHATIVDTYTNEEVACYNIQVSTVSGTCSGISCLIGKK